MTANGHAIRSVETKITGELHIYIDAELFTLELATQ